MKKFRNYIIIYFFILIFYLLGVYQSSTNSFPANKILEIKKYFLAQTRVKTNMVEKLDNDFIGYPHRHLSTKKIKFKTSEKNLHPKQKEYRNLKGLDHRTNIGEIKFYLHPKANKGYRAILGTFDLKDSLHALLLLDEKANLIHKWKLSQDSFPWPHREDPLITPHGFHLAQDGSLIHNFDSGSGLKKLDYCGKIIWQTPGGFHHSIEVDTEGNFWTWEAHNSHDASNLVKINSKTGKRLISFNMHDVYEANPHIDILSLKKINDKKWLKDPFHGNDIEPLTEKHIKAFPQFELNDLLISLRELNLIMVIDPVTLKIKWWRIGLGRRQHDPDWTHDGHISFFDNNMNRSFSKIVKVNPRNMSSITTIDGKKYYFYSKLQGNHQILNNGVINITSSLQGRVLEVNKKGMMEFDFLNNYGDKRLFIAESTFYEKDYFDKNLTCKEQD